MLQLQDAVMRAQFGRTGASGYHLRLRPQSADGFYHVQDEVMLPWFLRLAPNTVSEPTQAPSPNVGRYTFLGDLNGSRALTHPPASC